MLENEVNQGFTYHAYSVLLACESKQTKELFSQYFINDAWFSSLVEVSRYEQAQRMISQSHYDVIIIDDTFFPNTTEALTQIALWRAQQSQVLLIVHHDRLPSVVSQWHISPLSIIIDPLDRAQASHVIQLSMQDLLQRNMNSALLHDFCRHHSNEIIGESEGTVALKNSINRRCHDTTPLLIEGEPGVGKELVARQLHRHSRRNGPFMTLSGHVSLEDSLEKTFYGQRGNKENGREYVAGLFKQANGGTLYIDEIEDLPIQIQQTLLSVFDTGKIRPVAAEHDVPIDVRVIAATNRPLLDESHMTNNPSPLLARLYPDRISVMPLRQRKSDLKMLLPFLAKRLCRDLCLPLPTWTEEDITIIRDYQWPGNVRELKNLVENCILLKQSPSDYWQRTHHIQHKTPVTVTVSNGISIPTLNDDPRLEPYYQTQGYPPSWTLKQIERHHIEKIVMECEGNRSAAARALGVNRKTLERKFKEWEDDH
ncbi:sigma-54-dependent transcriptional regulator [Vibrio palustris]|uniref:Psp operon transcriptional activator n=1 Tax=Vibrio palustris TaxID=1918946 RepID=A0A1R4B2I6_9VIBR|nr:sigma 54-interacting transcriptional regulator [Vibrio palustris]SJL83127.1 Psp operon transcriptional activator [Vibrio palustris]